MPAGQLRQGARPARCWKHGRAEQEGKDRAELSGGTGQLVPHCFCSLWAPSLSEAAAEERRWLCAGGGGRRRAALRVRGWETGRGEGSAAAAPSQPGKVIETAPNFFPT